MKFGFPGTFYSYVSLVGLVFIVIFFMLCCRQPINTYENNMGVKPVVLAQIDTVNYTIIHWKDSVQDFGTINRGDALKLKFNFENAGETGLFFLEARASCGCTNLTYPENIILPGEKGELNASFSTGSQPAGIVYKTI